MLSPCAICANPYDITLSSGDVITATGGSTVRRVITFMPKMGHL